MTTFLWKLPPGSSGSSGGGASSPDIVGQSIVATGGLDLVFDPITRDLIDATDGGFVESTDSRTAVLLQMESEYLAWWGDPFSGSRIADMLSGEDPADINDVRDEVLRVLQPLVTDGILSDLTVTLDVDEVGRPVVLLNYTDRSSGRPIDLAYVPFGG